ncbi:unnamed protein product [Nesidiocoris tenuis]|uniref:RRM domain-containing protein n=1 Tax=Nesidiocoris tenuis TaxID=355587 RepID=A0A6H5GRQ1_9HEMI|nr:unnamed protein product [Nesidiocoris tenuis]
MPAIEDTKISSWADEVDETSEDLPPPSEVIDNGLKIVTVYRRNEDGKKRHLISNLHSVMFCNLVADKPSKYIPPYMRDGAKGRGDAMGHRGQRDDSCAIRLSNLSESTQEVDLEELVRPFGDYSKLFLAKDKNTGACKGFAYIHFKHKLSAANAIAFLDGHGYDHLILAAEWSKPQVQQH